MRHPSQCRQQCYYGQKLSRRCYRLRLNSITSSTCARFPRYCYTYMGSYDAASQSFLSETIALCLVPLCNNYCHHISRFGVLFSQVFQGILLACQDRFQRGSGNNQELAANDLVIYLVSLWAHECSRVFSDKMTSHEDKAWVESTIINVARSVYIEHRSVLRKHQQF